MLNVIRKGPNAIYYVQSDNVFNVGDVVQQKIGIVVSIICNNIQVCFSCCAIISLNFRTNILGQHLITAVFEQDFGFDTTTWSLGSETSFIELNTSNVSSDQLQRAERKMNKFIADQTTVSVVRVSGDETRIPPEVE